MYIRSLYLKNIRSYGNQEIELSKGINLLVGANNAGKSTIIKALYKLQRGNSLGKEDIRKTTKRGEIAIRFEEMGEDDIPLFRVGREMPKLETVPEGGKIVVQYELKADKEQNDQAFLYDPNGKDSVFHGVGISGKNEAGAEVSLIVFSGLPDMENEKNFIYPFFAKRKRHYYHHSRGTEATYQVHEDLSNLASKIQKVTSPSFQYADEYNRLCEKILGFKIGVIPGEQQEDRIGIYVGDSFTIPLESMGEGVMNVLGLLVILLTENNKLFLIEELENDLHPAALKELLQLIIAKAGSNQFIISTHSNIVVKYLGSVPGSFMHHVVWKPYELGSGVKVPSSTIQLVLNTAVARMEMLQNLGYDLFDFGTYSGFLILEESSAEQIIREFLMPHFTPSLVNRLRTIASQGADDLPPKFQDLHRLFLFVHSDPIYKHRAWAVADGDPIGIKIIKELKKSFRSWPSEHFVTFSQPAFEHYYPERFRREVCDVLGIKNKRERKQAKGDLLRNVLNWARTNPKDAKPAFEKSAAEVIQLLKRIEAEMVA